MKSFEFKLQEVKYSRLDHYNNTIELLSKKMPPYFIYCLLKILSLSFILYTTLLNLSYGGTIEVINLLYQ